MKWNAKIGIGSVQFGLPYGISNTTGQTPPEEVAKILNHAFANGIRLIDTASAYGTSEAVIGQLHDHRFALVSKFMPPQKGESISTVLDESLGLLKTDQLYGYLAHRPLALLDDPEVWANLQKLKQMGKIKKIGFSLNTPEEFYELEKAGLKPDLVQVPFNYFDTRFKAILIQLKSEGCEIHTRSTFLQGLFFTDIEKLSPFFEELKPKLQYLHQQYGEKLQGALLHYVVQQPFVDVVIMGIETVKQIEMNLQSLIDTPVLAPIAISYSKELLMPMHWPKN
jgi:aryl-alcohol dehydrogenase-like predicted oxidoreductase